MAEVRKSQQLFGRILEPMLSKAQAALKIASGRQLSTHELLLAETHLDQCQRNCSKSEISPSHFIFEDDK